MARYSAPAALDHAAGGARVAWRAAVAAVVPAVVGEVLTAWVPSGGRDGHAGYWALACPVPAVEAVTHLAVPGPDLACGPDRGDPVLAGLYGLAASLLVLPPRGLWRRMGENSHGL